MAEDTQAKEIENGNESLIQEMLRDAKVADVPSESQKNPVIHKGDETLEAPMTVKEISSAGHVWVWDTRTFEKIPIIYYMLPSKLRLRRPDGSFRFTTINPGKEPKGGHVKCMLHRDSPNREHYDDLSFRYCAKSNLINDYQLQQHMIRKHPQEWAAIKEERDRKEKEEDRALQRALLAQQLGKQEEPEKKERQNIINKENRTKKKRRNT